MNSPFTDLSLEEHIALLARSSSGEYPVFAGEEAGGPQIDLARHSIHTGQFFEVDPDQLIDVAKHVGREGESAKQTIERAYTLICEAHLTSRNIKHWNENTRRNHVSEKLHSIVEEHVVITEKDKGKVPRLAALKELLKSRGKSPNDTDTGKLFNTWVRESLRLEDYSRTIPWNPTRADFDETLYKNLIEKGWIRWLEIGRDGYLIIPEETSKPRTKPRKKINQGDHVTRPWWETKNVWWPNPTQSEVKAFKTEYLTSNYKYFHSSYSAKRALLKFDRWLDLVAAQDQQTKKPKSKVKRDPDSGEFK